mgnify:CR=1 FL=1
MKHIKQLLFLSILFSLVLFTNCGDSDDPVADDTTDTTGDTNTDDDSNTVLDADGDGVADADDTCADTPSGETVDSSGCSDSQKDTDGDGVTDDLDTCEDTAEGTTVDGNGCSDSQKDTDGDGVSDDLDTCADTPEGTTVDENGCAVTFLYLDENGITIKATEYAVVGESYELDSVSYLVVDNDLLYQMITDENDITKVVTSNVTYMRGMFYTLTNSVFNQDISSWDVSNVTDMIGVFHRANSFNQDISSWDVSNVQKMSDMFNTAKVFNQDISSWDVSNVTDCEGFSTGATAWTEPKPNFTNCDDGSDTDTDTDGDGISDDLDTCADTPSGETVDSNGCSDSQKDTDIDGVTDDLDTCPETAAGAEVDENGCVITTDDSTSSTFNIDVTASSSSNYNLSGTDRNGDVSGNDPELTFKVGDVINFSVNASGHPFYLKTTAGTGVDNTISGVTNNGTTDDTASWTPTTAGTYYYQCSLHGGMVGTIIIE